MPKIRRHKLAQSILVHLLTRIRERKIPHEQITLLARWLDTKPEVPGGKCFKQFAGFTVCGEGEFTKTLLLSGQAVDGREVV